MTNDELLAAWRRKLPGVEPADRELSAFALGVEVGAESLLDEVAALRANLTACRDALLREGIERDTLAALLRACDNAMRLSNASTDWTHMREAIDAALAALKGTP